MKESFSEIVQMELGYIIFQMETDTKGSLMTFVCMEEEFITNQMVGDMRATIEKKKSMALESCMKLTEPQSIPVMKKVKKLFILISDNLASEYIYIKLSNYYLEWETLGLKRWQK